MLSRLRRKKIADAEGEHSSPKPVAAKSATSQNDEAERISQDFIVASLEALKDAHNSVEPESPSEADDVQIASVAVKTEGPPNYDDEHGEEVDDLAYQIMAAGRKGPSTLLTPSSTVRKPTHKKTNTENKLHERQEHNSKSVVETSDKNEDIAPPRQQLDDILLEIVRRDIGQQRRLLKKKSLY